MINAEEKSVDEQHRSVSAAVSSIPSDGFGHESESSRSKSSKNIEDLMESFATDMRPSDSGVNRVLKMFTGATVSDNIAHSEAAAIEVPILHQLTVGCPSLNTGANEMFCPVDKDLPSTIIAHSLASLHMQYSLNNFFNENFHSNEKGSSALSLDENFNDEDENAANKMIENKKLDNTETGEKSETNLGSMGNAPDRSKVVVGQLDSKTLNQPLYRIDNAREKRKILVSNKESDIVDKFKDVDAGHNFEVTSYFAAQFYALRQSYLLGETEEEYIQSLVQSRPWRTSGGKSSAQFSKTLDGRFVIKCVSAEEFNMFHHQCACGVYFVYMDKTIFQNCPSALVKIMGMHRIKTKSQTGTISIKYVVIMQNLFAGVDTSNMRLFDLKGKIRYYSKRIQKGTVLLDGDLLRMTNGLPLPLTKESNELVGDAINNDSLFLKIADIVDYSLIIGIDRTTKAIRMGVIDFMHSYDMKKRLESNLKGIISEATIRPPTVYSDRFLNGFETYFCAVPQKPSKSKRNNRNLET